MSFVREQIIKPYQSYAPKVLGGKRSRKWPRIRKEHIRDFEPACIACGRSKKLQVHHKVPFSKKPELELEHDNLATLCMGATRCHFWAGHLGSWRSSNPTVMKDSAWFRNKVENRK